MSDRDLKMMLINNALMVAGMIAIAALTKTAWGLVLAPFLMFPYKIKKQDKEST